MLYLATPLFSLHPRKDVKKIICDWKGEIWEVVKYEEVKLEGVFGNVTLGKSFKLSRSTKRCNENDM